jgi:hypothetical protein
MLYTRLLLNANTIPQQAVHKPEHAQRPGVVRPQHKTCEPEHGLCLRARCHPRSIHSVAPLHFPELLVCWVLKRIGYNCGHCRDGCKCRRLVGQAIQQARDVTHSLHAWIICTGQLIYGGIFGAT